MSETIKPSISRRGFLKAASVTAASTLAESVHVVTAQMKDSSQGPRTAGPGAVPIVLHINGTAHSLSVEPRHTLAEALRDTLGLTGTKVVCDRGSCSACTVWIDKVPTLSCMTLAIDVGSRNITTIEGIASGTQLHPVQAAFVKHDAMQCGFCTPGMVMSCVALLDRNPKPTLDDVKQAVSGNLCRCGTYPKVFAATLEAAQLPRANNQIVSASKQERS